MAVRPVVGWQIGCRAEGLYRVLANVFVCEVSFEGVVCGVCYVIFQFFDSFSYFLCGFVVMC